MKGKISLKDFIKSVKEEIVSSLDSETPFFEISKVQLEASFELSAEGGADFNLYVIDASTKANATQTHKVVIDLTPLGAGISSTYEPAASTAIVKRSSEKKISIKPIRGPVVRRPDTGQFIAIQKPKKKPSKKA